jgi:peptide-methionine (R)-S-oxide reductase
MALARSLSDADAACLCSSFSSPLEHEKRAGSYGCAGCGAPLFSSSAKFDSGTGWPSYFEALPGAVEQTIQPLYCLGDFGARECRCARCGCHLGHVFTDGPKPTGLRYCMNGVALAFSAAGGDA